MTDILRKQLSSVVVLAFSALMASAGPAAASVTIGNNLAGGGVLTNTPGCAVDCTVTTQPPTGNPGVEAPGGLRSPIDGIVTSWRFASGSAGNQVSLRVLRLAGGLAYTGAGTSAPQTTATGINGPLPTQLPIKVGDGIGVNATAGTLILRMTAQAGTAYWNPFLPDGTTLAGTAGSSNQVMVEATVEPDVDCDGKGDETQDGSVLDGPCAAKPPADSSAPNARIKKVIVDHPAGKAKVKFTGSDNLPGALTFKCKVDHRKFRKCHSPKTYRHLKPGHHRVKVLAIDAAGNVDPTPAKKRFTV